MKWPLVRIDSLYTVARGGSPRPIKKFITDDKSGINWIKISDATASNKYIFKTREKILRKGIKHSRLVKEGDFLLSNSMSFGRPYIMKTSGCIHDGWLVLSPKGNNINQDFLYYALTSPFVFKQFDLLAAGSTVRNLNIDLVSGVQIPLPPIQEQKHIVALLDQAFADIEKIRANTEKNLKNARELFESYLQQVFSQGGDEWIDLQVSEIIEINKTPHDGTPLPYVGMEDIEAGTGMFLGEESPKEVKSNTFKFTSDHILYGRLRPYLNKAAMPNFIGHCSTEIFPIRVKKYMKKEFFFLWLTLSSTVKQINETCTGARMPRANINEFMTFTVPCPLLNEQADIFYKTDKLKKQFFQLEKIYNKKLFELDHLKKSLLHQAFTGQLIKQEASLA